MIEQFYLTHKFDPTILGQSGPESNGNEGLLHIPQTLGLELHHQIQFCIRPRTLKFLFFLMQMSHSHCFLAPLR